MLKKLNVSVFFTDELKSRYILGDNKGNYYKQNKKICLKDLLQQSAI